MSGHYYYSITHSQNKNSSPPYLISLIFFGSSVEAQEIIEKKMSISSIVNLAAGKIGELLVEEAKLLYGVEDQVQSLQEDLNMMNSYFKDMESLYEEVDDERSRAAIKQIRRIAYDAEDVIESYILEADKKENLFKRMYIPFPTKSQHLRSLEYVVVEEKERPSLLLIHENFRLLRVLLLVGVTTSDGSLPAGIGSLIHLRYLGLRRTNISELSSSIGNLRNLLTLEWRSASYALELRIPDVLWKIEGFRHLNLKKYYATINMETLKLHTLKQLQTLKGVVGGSWMLKELPLLSPTVQKLTILNITSQEQLDAAFQCPSIRTDRVQKLTLRWEEAVKLENLEPIIHSQHLRKLRLIGRMGDGLGIQFPTSIKKLVLSSTELEAEATLVALGKLPQLTILELLHMAYVGTKWTCTAREFPQLKELLLLKLENLEEWSIGMGAMPQLSKLTICGCEKLRKLPEGLKFITTLQELQLGNMPEEFKKSIKGGGEDAHIIQHVPLVKIG